MAGRVNQGEGTKIGTYQIARCSGLTGYRGERLPLDLVEKCAFSGIGLAHNHDGIVQPLKNLLLGLLPVHGLHQALYGGDVGRQVLERRHSQVTHVPRATAAPQEAIENTLLYLLLVITGACESVFVTSHALFPSLV